MGLLVLKYVFKPHELEKSLRHFFVADMRGRDELCRKMPGINVLGSSGSVIPIFHNQIAKGGPLTLTDPEMTRFIMSIPQAVRLVIDSADLARSGPESGMNTQAGKSRW